METMTEQGGNQEGTVVMTGNAPKPGSVAERLASLRADAVAEVKAAQARTAKAETEFAEAKRARVTAVNTALEVGVPADELAAIVKVGAGTVKSWGKSE